MYSMLKWLGRSSGMIWGPLLRVLSPIQKRLAKKFENIKIFLINGNFSPNYLRALLQIFLLKMF